MTLTYLEFSENGIRTAVLKDGDYNFVGNAVVIKNNELLPNVNALSLDSMDSVKPTTDYAGAYAISEKRTLEELEKLVMPAVLRMAEQQLNKVTDWYNKVQSHENNKLHHFLSSSLRNILMNDRTEYVAEKRALENGSSDEDTVAILTMEEIDGKLRAIDDVLTSKTRDDLNKLVMRVNDEQINAFVMFRDVTGTAYDPHKEYDYENTWDTGLETFCNIVRTDGYLSIISVTSKLN